MIVRRRRAACLAAAIFLTSCSAAEQAIEPQRATPAAAAGPRGRIRGIVILRGTAALPRSQPVAQNQDVCGSEVPVTRLAVGRNNGVRHAIVHLDGMKPESAPQPRVTVAVEQRQCRYVPYTLVVPAGAPIEIVNDDPILHNVHARERTSDGPRTVFNIAQPIRGQRTQVEVPLERPGIIELSCEAGHPWMSAYMLVSTHPYAAVSGDDGEFVIEDVPVGTYPVKLWHPGVMLTRVIASLQRFEYEAPYEITQQVVVEAGRETVVNFELELRAAAGS